jgi:hypothetical protein
VAAQTNRSIRKALQSRYRSAEPVAIRRSLRRMGRAEFSSLTKRKIAAKHLISRKLKRLRHGYEQRRFTVCTRSMREH